MGKRSKVWLTVIAGIVGAAVLAVFIWYKQQPIYIRGAIMVQNSDPRKQLPILGAIVSTSSDVALSKASSDSSGLFVLRLRKRIRFGHALTLHISHAQYRPFDLQDIVQNKLYIVYLTPLSSEVTPQGQPKVSVSNVRIRFTVEAFTEQDVGSAVKTFQIQNTGNIPCKGQHPCSPDGQWKASLGSGSLDAGPGNEFRDVRTSCIAGPCPFTRIETDDFSKTAHTVTVSARDWSNTATFLLEAEVFRPMLSQTEHWSYPVVFGDELSFTLPTDAESVSIQADVDKQTITFPLGPSLFLSWARCDGSTQGRARVYRCSLKPGYRFS